jgi:hypothetical protein
MHTASENADLRSTISQSRYFIRQLMFFRSSLEAMDRILRTLEEEMHGFTVERSRVNGKEPLKETSNHVSNFQISMWNRNLIRQLRLIEHRIRDLIEGQRAIENMVSTYLFSPPDVSAYWRIGCLIYSATPQCVSGDEYNPDGKNGSSNGIFRPGNQRNDQKNGAGCQTYEIFG